MMANEYGDGLPREPASPNPVWKVAMIGVPAFLLLSTGVALWIWWKKSQEDAIDPRLALASMAAEVEELEDSIYKLSKVLGVRGWDTLEGRRNMRRAVALIDGTLSPQNYGFPVKKRQQLSYAGDQWPTVWVDLAGKEDPSRVVLVAAPYDGSDAAIAVVLAVARDLRDESFGPTIRFIFYPAQLYRDVAEGKSLVDVLEKGESHLATLLPDVLEESAGPWNGVRLKPIADAFADRVRQSAEDR